MSTIRMMIRSCCKYGFVSLVLWPFMAFIIPLIWIILWLGFGILCFVGFYFLELRHNEDWNSPKVIDIKDIKHYEMTEEDKKCHHHGFGEFWGQK